MNFTRTAHPINQLQRGAALMIMLVIMILGVSFFLVSALSSTSLRIASDKKTSDVLAQAKEALIARSVADSTQPGSLPCPDLTGTGDAEVAADCTSYIGRLPWKTLGLPNLRDASGAPLWYALSRNFRKDPGTSHINSDTQGTLIVTGNPSSGNVVAIVFAPGANLSGQSRSDTQTAACTTTGSTVVQSLCATNYLEGIGAISNANPSLTAAPNTQYVAGDASNTFNDQMIYITADNLLPNVEKRIAREIKQCLDNYAASPSVTIPTQANGKYPWAVPVATPGYTGVTGKLFGRVPDQPTTTTTVGGSTDTVVVALTNALNNLQTAVNNCKVDDTLQPALTTAGNALLTAISNINVPPYNSSFGSTFVTKANAAGNAATNINACNNIESNPVNNLVQINLNNANSYLPSSVTEDLSMPTTWPAACILPALPSAYWTDWKEMVFYSVSNAYHPNGVKDCVAGCIAVNGNGNPNQGSGSYRAAVIVAGKNLTAARTHAILSTYLEGVNAVPSTTTLETWQLTEQKTKNINDFVVCIDGKGIDQNSKCY